MSGRASRRPWVLALFSLIALALVRRPDPLGSDVAPVRVPQRPGARPEAFSVGSGETPGTGLPWVEPAVFITLPTAEWLGVLSPGTMTLGSGGLALPGAGGLRRRAGSLPWGRAAIRVRALDLPWLTVVLGITGLALAMRLVGYGTNYDVFIDEITYSVIGQAVALNHGVSLYGSPFFLHPPLFFYLEGGLLDLFGGAHASPVALVHELRPINCVIGAIDCALIMALVRRCANRAAAVAVGVFIAVDPFLLLWDGRVLLESLAMTTAIGGWLCLTWVAVRDTAGVARLDGSSRAEEIVIALGGVLFGASLLSKETYAFAGVVPLFGMLVLGSPIRRRVTGLMLTIAMGCYLAFILSVVAGGHVGDYWKQQFSGLLRAVGTKQQTGFNKPGQHSGLGSSLASDLSLYLVSYGSIGLVGLAALIGAIRWFRGARGGQSLSAPRRLAIALGVGSVGYVVYAMMFGAFETQIFYMCILGGLPALATELSASWPRLGARIGRRRLLALAGVLAALALAFELHVDVMLRTQDDTALTQLVDYVEHDLRYPALVDSTDAVSSFIMQGVGIDGVLTIRGLEKDRPGYVVLDTKLVAKGYVELGPGFLGWLRRHATPIWRTSDRSSGQILLYRTVYATTGQGPGAGAAGS